MAAQIENSPFFLERKSAGKIVVKDPPKFDLESYIANYDGPTRLFRLHHIGTCSPFFAVDAFHMAIREAKKGKNVPLYLRLVEDFSKIAPDDPLAIPDLGWAEKKQREVKDEGDKLEQELRSYKNNLIKESIRMGNEDLGHFYFACGDYPEAQRAYQRMREYCTSAKHLTDMSLRLVYVGVTQGTWTGIQSALVKVDASSLKSEEKAKLEPIVSACSGLAYMATGHYLEAASSFIQTSPTFITLDVAAGITWQREVMSGNDVAVYGGLCALASMDRNELQQRVLANSDFRSFLELEPQIRRAIHLFCNSKYSACLEVLEAYRNDYLLDVYLSPQLSRLYRSIRIKCIVQYFIPFSCVTLDEMASKFQVTGGHATIVGELEEMINSGILDARIDLVDGLLISPPTNSRYSVHSDALAMAEKYEHTLQLRLTRLNLLNAGLTIQADKHQDRKGDEGLLRNLGSKLGFS